MVMNFEIPMWPQPGKVIVPVSKPDLSSVERDLLLEAFDSGWIGSGSKFVSDCEEELSAFLGVEDSTLVSNGSVAIILALRALGVDSGDEVIVPSLTYAATASSVVHVGANPVFCDVDTNSWQITADEISKAFTDKTKAVIVPHTYGVSADMAQIRALTDELGIFLIEDCAESFGAEFEGQKVGTFGDVATFSFFPNKLLTSGEGGLVIAKSEKTSRNIKLLRGQGMSQTHRYVFEVPGFNFRITGLQAAILLGQLQRLPELWKARMESEDKMTLLLSKHVTPPTAPYSFKRAPWIFSARLNSASPMLNLRIAESLAIQGIETRPVFWPLGRMKAFSAYRILGDRVATEISQQSISLPSGPHVTEEVESRILDSISSVT